MMINNLVLQRNLFILKMSKTYLLFFYQISCPYALDIIEWFYIFSFLEVIKDL